MWNSEEGLNQTFPEGGKARIARFPIPRVDPGCKKHASPIVVTLRFWDGKNDEKKKTPTHDTVDEL